MSRLVDTGSGLNLGNIEYHQSVTERHPNLVLEFAYLKDLEDVDPFNISGVDREKVSENRKGGVYVTVVITYKNFFVANRKTATVSPNIGEGVACNTIFSWPFLQKIKASIITENNGLVIGLLGYQFSMEMMVPQRSNEATKILEDLFQTKTSNFSTYALI